MLKLNKSQERINLSQIKGQDRKFLSVNNGQSLMIASRVIRKMNYLNVSEEN